MTALDWLLKLTLLLVVAFALAFVLRKAAAVVRHRVWVGALVAALCAPVVAQWISVPVLGMPTILPVHTVSGVGSDIPESGVAAIIPQSGKPRILPNASTSALEILAMLWLIVAVILLLRLAWSAAAVKRIISLGAPLNDPRWTALLYELADRLGLDDVPLLLMSNRTNVPLACRLRRPAIVLPTTAVEWPEERRRVVLLHELAHIKRRDLIGHALSRAACAVYWFHPMVWFAAARLRSESERACDDLVLRGGAAPSLYAHQLISMVAELRPTPAPTTAMAMGADGEFEGRIVAILDSTVMRRPRGRVQAVLPAATVLVVGVILAIVHPARVGAATAAIPQLPRRAAVAQLPADTSVLRRMLQSDPDEDVRVAVAWALHTRNDAAAMVASSLASDRSASVREMAAWSLGQIGDSSMVQLLYAQLRSETVGPVRATIAWSIGQLRGDLDALLPLLDDSDTRVIRMATWAIGQNPPRRAPRELLMQLRHREPGIRFMTAWTLGEIADPSGTPALEQAYRTESDEAIRRALARALFESGDGSPALMEELLSGADAEIRSRAVQVLAGQKPRPWPMPLPMPDPRPVE